MQICIFQTGEPLHIDKGNYRPMRCMLLADKLIDKGHKVSIISSDFHHQRKVHRTNNFSTFNINSNLSIHLIPSLGYKKHISFRRIADHFILAVNLYLFLKKNKIFKPAKFFIGYPPILSSLVLSIWCKKNNIPYMLDVKDKWPIQFLEPFSNRIKKIIRLLIEPYFISARLVFRNSNKITSITDSYIHWIKNFANINNKNNCFVSPLIRKPLFLTKEQNDEALRSWLKLSLNIKKTRYFCFIGSFTKSFDFDFIYKSAELLIVKNPEIKFVICGSGDQYKNIIQKFDSCQNVLVFGEINKYMSKVLIKNSIATLAPYINNQNFKDHVPNKIIESLENNTPFITTLDGKLKSIVEEYNNGIFIRNQHHIDITKYQKIINDKDYQKYLSKNAEKSFKKLFDFNKTFDKIIENLILM